MLARTVCQWRVLAASIGQYKNTVVPYDGDVHSFVQLDRTIVLRCSLYNVHSQFSCLQQGMEHHSCPLFTSKPYMQPARAKYEQNNQDAQA